MSVLSQVQNIIGNIQGEPGPLVSDEEPFTSPPWSSGGLGSLADEVNDDFFSGNVVFDGNAVTNAGTVGGLVLAIQQKLGH